MKTLFHVAALIRKSIRKCKRWVLTGALNNITDGNVPMELFSLFRWAIQGPFVLLSSEKKSSEVHVHKRAKSLTQNTVTMCLSDCQVKRKKSETTRMTAEMPRQLATGLAVHQAVRSKELIRLHHRFGMSVDYNQVLRVESQIESNVLQRMEQNDSVYLRPDIVKGLMTSTSPKILLMARVRSMALQLRFTNAPMPKTRWFMLMSTQLYQAVQ